MKHLYELTIFKEKKINRRAAQLESSLTAFSQITDIPVSFYSNVGKFQWSTLPGNRICDANREFGSENYECTRILMSSMNISLSLSDVYIFMCNAGFINLCYALTLDHKVCGFFMAGPIAMGSKKEKVISSFSSKLPSASVDYAHLMTLISKLKLYSPKEVTYLSALFQNSIIAPLEFFHSSDTRGQRHQEQSDIGKKLIAMKKEHLTIEYPYASESSLIEVIKTGNTDLCLEQFSKYMDAITALDGGNLSIIKLRLIAFITQLLKSDDQWQRNYENFFSLEKINEAQTLKKMLKIGGELILALTESVTTRAYNGSSVIIKEAVSYLYTHYRDNINLKSLAETIHVNSSYLSTLFKQEMGVPFVTYLNNIRLAHAEELLMNTSMTITEICLNTGFSSSSYFTKLFNEKNGITPTEFRHDSG